MSLIPGETQGCWGMQQPQPHVFHGKHQKLGIHLHGVFVMESSPPGLHLVGFWLLILGSKCPISIFFCGVSWMWILRFWCRFWILSRWRCWVVVMLPHKLLNSWGLEELGDSWRVIIWKISGCSSGIPAHRVKSYPSSHPPNPPPQGCSNTHSQFYQPKGAFSSKILV